MKTNRTNTTIRPSPRGWTLALTLFALLGHVWHCQALRAIYCTVTINDTTWSCGYDEPTCSTPLSKTGPDQILCGKCGSAVAAGGAFFAYSQAPGCSNEVDVPGTVTIEDNGTGALIEPLSENAWRISAPQQSGSIKVKATVSGKCGCPGGDITLTAEGTLRVIVPTEEEGGCSACQPTCSANIPSLGSGSPALDQNGLSFTMSLGPATPGHNGGLLVLQTNTASPVLSTAGPLTASAGPGTTVLPGSDGTIRQIKCPQGLVHVKTNNAYEYQLECYLDSDVIQTPTNGFYATNPYAQPFVTWKITNPNGASAVNRLTITELRDGATRASEFTNTVASLRWDLGRPDGSVLSAWQSQVSSGVTNLTRQTSAGSQVLKKRQETWQTVSGLSYPLLTQAVDGDSPVSETNSYQYYSSDPANGAYTNKLKRADYPDGQWSYFVYDSLGRTQKVYSALGNNPPPSSGEPSAIGDQCRLTEFYYTLSTTDDGITNSDEYLTSTPRKLVVSVPVGSGLHEVSRTLQRVWGNPLFQTERCPLPGAHWGDSGNLRETTETFDVGDTRGMQPRNIVHPDLTVTLYGYTSDGALTMTGTGESDDWSNPHSIINGQRTDITLNDWGQPLSRITTEMQAASSVLTLSSETYNYSISPADPLNRSYDVTDLAGRTIQYRYGCCGLSSVSDADSINTSYDYDPMLRRVATTLSYGGTAVKTTNILDFAGRTCVTKRIGSDNSPITLSQTLYDVLGRPMRQTNALLGVTIITNTIVSNRRCVTNIFPDGGTRIETYYRDSRLESVSGTAVSSVKYFYGVEQDGSGGPWREFTLEVKLDSGGGTNEWTETLFDGAGRPYKAVYAAASQPYPFRASTFNGAGQRIAERDPDGVTNLFAYNSVGELITNAVDLDQDGNIDAAVDRVTASDRSYVAASGGLPPIIRTDTYGWVTEGSSSVQKTLSRDEISADGLRSWHTVWRDSSTPVVRQTTNVYASAGNRYQTNIAPDGSYSVVAYSYGRLSWSKRFASDSSPLSSSTFGYDVHGRQNTITDARNGQTTFTFNNADQIVSTITPDPGVLGASAQTTTTFYDTSFRAWKITQPDNTSVTNEFYPNGLIKRTYGSRTYPVAYTYDAQGRMTTMTNWSTFSSGSGARVTAWNYDQYRGWLLNKRYPDAGTGNPGSLGPDYAYTPGGRLKTRLWARIGTGSLRIATTNTYGFESSGDKHGDLVAIDYYNDPQSTPGVTFAYDRLGRQKTLVRSGITTTFDYNDAAEVQVERYSGGMLANFSITNGYDEFLRRTNLAALNSTTSILLHSYGYDLAARLQTVSDNASPANTATYSYLANSPLISQIQFKHGTTNQMTTTKQYDFLNRLLSISNAPSASSAVSFSYEHNNANQRTRCRLADGSLWIYEYDFLGQLISGKHYWPDWTPVAGQQFEYTFDEIGNRTATKAGGDENASNLRSATYGANRLNQYTNRSVPGAVDLMGLALTTESVTVNSQSAYRKGEYFRKELAVDNTTAPLWTNITVTASPEPSASGNVFVPKTAEAFTYDDDGNLTSDGRWTNRWDAENRLIGMESLTNGPSGSKLRLTFSYDNRSRRITKQVENWTGSVWSTTVSNRFLYDAWNLVAQLNGTNSSPIETFMWGTDLSGSVQGAGGVGGLLAVSDSSQGTHFAAFDANGNATALVKAADGTSSAKYEYNPFGEDLRTTGPMGKENPLLFSNKVADRETDLRYYGLRYYSPSISAWLARDPISDPEDNLRLAGKQFSVVRDVDLRINSLNLAGEPVIYRYAGNDALNFVDPVGRLKFIGCSPDKQNQLTKDFNGYCAKLKTSLPGCCKNKTILPKLQHICDNSQDYTVQCEAHQLDDCSGNTCGWSRTGNRTIHFCPNGWNTIDCGPLGCTVMHEFTHEIGHPSEKWPRQVEKCLGCP